MTDSYRGVAKPDWMTAEQWAEFTAHVEREGVVRVTESGTVTTRPIWTAEEIEAARARRAG